MKIKIKEILFKIGEKVVGIGICLFAIALLGVFSGIIPGAFIGFLSYCFLSIIAKIPLELAIPAASVMGIAIFLYIRKFFESNSYSYPDIEVDL